MKLTKLKYRNRTTLLYIFVSCIPSIGISRIDHEGMWCSSYGNFKIAVDLGRCGSMRTLTSMRFYNLIDTHSHDKFKKECNSGASAIYNDKKQLLFYCKDSWIDSGLKEKIQLKKKDLDEKIDIYCKQNNSYVRKHSSEGGLLYRCD